HGGGTLRFVTVLRYYVMNAIFYWIIIVSKTQLVIDISLFLLRKKGRAASKSRGRTHGSVRAEAHGSRAAVRSGEGAGHVGRRVSQELDPSAAAQVGAQEDPAVAREVAVGHGRGRRQAVGRAREKPRPENAIPLH